MKRWIQGLGVLGLMIGWAGCAPRQPVSLTPEEHALTVGQALRIMRIPSQVSCEDVDRDGVRDLYIRHLSEKEQGLTRRSYVFGAVTGVVMGNTGELTEPVEVVFFETHGELYRALKKDLEQCLAEQRGAKFDACQDRAWVRQN